MNFETLTEMLQTNIVNVEFTKLNGETRNMRCTLIEDFLPPASAEISTKKVNLDSRSVWDLDKDAWRAFRVDSVLSATVES